jgi:hypothetical protein
VFKFLGGLPLAGAATPKLKLEWQMRLGCPWPAGRRLPHRKATQRGLFKAQTLSIPEEAARRRARMRGTGSRARPAARA